MDGLGCACDAAIAHSHAAPLYFLEHRSPLIASKCKIVVVGQPVGRQLHICLSCACWVCWDAGYVEDPELTAFACALRDAKVVDLDDGMQLISFGLGSFFPDDVVLQRSDLVSRNFYSSLFERISSMRASLLTGIPGTGKSWIGESGVVDFVWRRTGQACMACVCIMHHTIMVCVCVKASHGMGCVCMH